MKLKITLILLLTCLCSTVFAQQDTIQVDFFASWKKGNAYRYKVTKTKTEKRGQEAQAPKIESYVLNLVVEDSTESGYLLNWQMEEMLTGSGIASSPELSGLVDKYKHLQLKYQADPDGAFVGLVEWQEFSKMMNEVFDQVINTAKGNEPTEMKKMMEPFRQAVSSKEGLENVAFKEIQFFHYPYGISLIEHDTLSYPDQLANLFGGDPIKADCRIYLTNVNQKNGTCRIINTSQLNQDDVRKMMGNLVEKMAGSTSFKSKKEKKAKLAEFKAELDKMELDIRDNRELLMDYNTVMPKKITSSRITTVKTAGEVMVKTEEIKFEALN